MLEERLRRHSGVGILDRPRDLVPVQPAVQPYPDPAAVAHVGRAEVVLGLGAHERVLHPLRRGAPQRQPSVVVMVVVEHHERLYVAHEEGRLAVREALGDLGEGEADRADALERRRRHSSPPSARPAWSARSSRGEGMIPKNSVAAPKTTATTATSMPP